MHTRTPTPPSRRTRTVPGSASSSQRLHKLTGSVAACAARSAARCFQRTWLRVVVPQHIAHARHLQHSALRPHQPRMAHAQDLAQSCLMLLRSHRPAAGLFSLQLHASLTAVCPHVPCATAHCTRRAPARRPPYRSPQRPWLRACLRTGCLRRSSSCCRHTQPTRWWRCPGPR